MERERIASILKLILLIVTLCVVVSLFTLPIIISMLPTDNNHDTLPPTYNNTNTNSSNSTQDCELSVMWGKLTVNNLTSADDCLASSDVYTDTVCHNVLSNWQLCVNGGKTALTVTKSLNDPGLTINQRETQVRDFSSLIVNHDECYRIALPFLCQYYFPLSECDVTSSITYTATNEDCLSISNGVCSQLWNLAIVFGYGNILPNCQILPKAIIQNDTSSTDSPPPSSTNNTITCRSDFIDINSSSGYSCHPRCDSFEQYSHTGTLTLIYSELFTSIIGLLIVLLIVMLSIKNYKSMFTYPSVILLLIVIDYSIIALLSIITAIDRHKLFCSSISLLESIENPTVFCTITGALFHYTLVNMCFLWFFHVCIFFHKVLFPFHAHKIDNDGINKYIFMTILALAYLIPSIAVILCLSVDKFEYRIRRFPPTICFSNTTNVWFISGVVLMDIIVCIGVCLLIIILWTLHKHKEKYSSRHRGSNSVLGTAEKKVIIVFSSVILFSVFALADLSNYIAKSEQFTTALTRYFSCEAFGYEPDKCDRSSFTDIYTPYTTLVTQILMALIPLAILNYIIKWKPVKNSVRRTVRSYRKREASPQTQEDISMKTATDSTSVVQ